MTDKDQPSFWKDLCASGRMCVVVFFVMTGFAAVSLFGPSPKGIERAIAQPAGVPGLYLASPTGNEQINVLGLGPQIETVTINQIRNAAGYTLVPAGTTVTTNVPNTSSIVLATGAITTWNVNFPTAPFDGLTLKVGCPGGNAGTINLAATLPSGVAIVSNASFGACTSNADAAWIYSASANVWYRTE